MFCKRPSPLIGKLTNSSISGNNGGLVEISTSPRSPLDFKIHSPRFLKNYDLNGVGLGIVAALEKKSPDVAGGFEIPASKALYNRSNPIPVNSPRNSCINRRNYVKFEMDDSSEEYTVVTCRRPGNKSYTRVYYDGGEEQSRGLFDRRSSKMNHRRPSVLFHISPARIGSESVALPDSDFLSSCHMCQKKLHGKDIYMYRGEKAFCSTECRYKQIVTDEHREKCSSQVSSSLCVTNKNGQIFSPGIFAI